MILFHPKQSISLTHLNDLSSLDVSTHHDQVNLEQLSSKIKLLEEELIKVKVDRDHWSFLAKKVSNIFIIIIY